MYRKLLLLAAPLLYLFFLAGSLYFGQERLLRHLAASRIPQHGRTEPPQESHSAKPADIPTADIPTADIPTAVEPVADGKFLAAVNITTYLDAILDRKPTHLPTLECPAINATRYETLQAEDSSDGSIRYVFALNLRQSLPLLPRLIGSIVEAIRFLGPKRCVLSIIEGNSLDGTADVLEALRPSLEALGIAYAFESSPIDPSKGERIARLAELRNLALQPLLRHPERSNKDTTIVFMNDVVACPEDILELAFQRKHLHADMTCAMDWTYVGRDPTFYDIWISRGMNGDSFFEIPPDGNWNSAWNLFWNAEETQSRFRALRPFQVFACWNGAAAFGAQPILENLRFRAPNSGECNQGEPQLFCKDLWFRGYRKIAVVPTVNLEYSVDKAKMIKEAKGFASDLVARQTLADDRIEWRPDPPEKVRCMPTWENQYWQLWNESLSK